MVEEEDSAEGRGPLILVRLVAFGQGTFKSNIELKVIKATYFLSALGLDCL